jgi:UDP-glucuronate 4-epimerase
MSFISPILVTGCAGFIGMHTSRAFLESGMTVIGVDNLNDYYDLQLKQDRLSQLKSFKNFLFYHVDIADRDGMAKIWQEHQPKHVINLAAQAGVRYSISHPFSYMNSNIIGFLNILELCRSQKNFCHLVYASTSSVYGSNKEIPFSEDQKTVNPISLYAATKASNELMAQAYQHLYHIPMTGLRFFTVYGPWGRPDMAYFKFAKAIAQDKPIEIFNQGHMKRDFTYITDIVNGIVAALKTQPTIIPGERHPIYNLGNHRSEELLHFVEILERAMGKTAQKEFLPMQAGDVGETFANIDQAQKAFSYQPTTTIEAGIPKFIDWFNDYFQLNKPKAA